MRKIVYEGGNVCGHRAAIIDADISTPRTLRLW